MAGGPDNLLFVTSVHSRSSPTHAHPTLLRHSLANSHMLKHLTSVSPLSSFLIAHIILPLHHRNTDVSSLVRQLSADE